MKSIWKAIYPKPCELCKINGCNGQYIPTENLCECECHEKKHLKFTLLSLILMAILILGFMYIILDVLMKGRL